MQTLLDLLKPEWSAEVMVCPPFVYLWETGRMLKDTDVALGAQSICAEAVGAFTGEVSGAMLRDVGCGYVLVGHSERRQLYGETDALVARKFVAAQAQGLLPVLCVGETLEERDAGKTLDVNRTQVHGSLPDGATAANTVIAYEPVWAIGTGRTATPEQAQEVHAMIRAELVGKLGQEIADGMRVLYGGSMNPKNAKELLALPDIDGGLIGGASLKAEDFFAVAEGSPA